MIISKVYLDKVLEKLEKECQCELRAPYIRFGLALLNNTENSFKALNEETREDLVIATVHLCIGESFFEQAEFEQIANSRFSVVSYVKELALRSTAAQRLINQILVFWNKYGHQSRVRSLPHLSTLRPYCLDIKAEFKKLYSSIDESLAKDTSYEEMIVFGLLFHIYFGDIEAL